MSNFLMIWLTEKNIRKERKMRDKSNPLEVFNDLECIQRYRFDRQAISDLTKLLYNDLVLPTKSSIPVVLQVCIALRFYSQGAIYRVSADCHNVDKSVQSRCVYKVSKSLVKRVNDFVVFPKNELDLSKIKQEFFKIAEMPNVIGAIDGTHIEIKTPNKDIESDFVNRKNRHSINVQAVCDAKLVFTNIVVKYPGRVHDSFIWNNCELKPYICQNNINGWLLGDSGYPLEPHLMTPYLQPSTEAQQRYNKSHTRTRSLIERSFGLLKMRFRAIDRSAGYLRLSPERCLLVITSCFILHNISKNYNFYGCIANDLSEENDLVVNHEVITNTSSQNIRETIVLQHFTD